MAEYEPKEQNLGGGTPAVTTTITLQQAIDFGEYRPECLANFPEWHGLSPHIQWQLIRKALDIRDRQLMTQYAELSNALDLRLKPEVQHAMKSVERQFKKLSEDREALYVYFSEKF